ncbi:MAG: GNAT family protein [Eubacteriales bacterium]|nr:GNAT family protein [Eubacteriales bacterium]
MKIQYRNIILRDRKESDIDDEIRWKTTDTQWALWDAPWEMEEELAKFDPVSYRKEELAGLARQKEGFRWSFEVDTLDGHHIGRVSSYLVDQNYEWVSSLKGRETETFYHTLGVDIHESCFWGKNLGTQALTAFIQYHLENGLSDLCLQTWSGNLRMVHVAEKLGFAVCDREVGFRQVCGETYDGLTFKLDESAFQNFLANNP